MVGLMQDDTDLEMTRYNEAAQIKQYSGLSVNTMRGGNVQYDPIRKVDGVYVDLPSGGKLRIGDRPVQVAQADTMLTQTDATAAPTALVPTAKPAPISLRPTAMAAAPQPIAEYDAQLRASSDRAPTAADFEVGGYTAEEFAQYQQSLQGPEMVPMKMTPDQTAEYAKQPRAMIASDYEAPGLFEGTVSEVVKGLVRGGIVEPAKFVNEMLGDTRSTFFQLVNPKTGEFEPRLMVVSAEEMANIMKMPFAPVGLEDLLKTDEQAGTGAQIAGGVGQFVGAFAGVGKLFKIGKGLLGAATQGAAADFLGFGGNDGRLTDVLLELGVPENRVTDFLRTDPSDPDYVGRFKNALEGAVLGGLVDQIAPVFRLIKDGGSATALGQAIGDLRFKAQQTSSNLLSDAIGVGRAVAAGDTRMLNEIVQPAGTPRSLGAAATEPSKIRPTEVDPNNLVFRESQQNRLESVKEMFPKGEGYYPVVSIFDNGERTILDGHNRAAVAMERGDTIPTVDVTKSEYDALVAAGFDDMEISYAALSRAKQDEAASAINQQFSGANVAERGTEAESILDNLAAAVAPETATAITAFHGSPYDFDAFDLSKIGTGEGAQAYGPGVYAAENEAIAKSYRDALADPFESGQTVARAYFNDAGSRAGAVRMLTEQLNGALPNRISLSPDQTSKMREALDFLNSGADVRDVKAPGYMYKIKINADPADFLDWDKLISEQPEKVQKVLMPFVEQRINQMGKAGNKFTAEEWMNRLRGGDVMLLDKTGDAPVSSALADAGIPGIRYLDKASRQSAEGTRNYVVLDDKLIDIVKKYGIAGLAVGAAIQSELGVNKQIEERANGI